MWLSFGRVALKSWSLISNTASSLWRFSDKRIKATDGAPRRTLCRSLWCYGSTAKLSHTVFCAPFDCDWWMCIRAMGPGSRSDTKTRRFSSLSCPGTRFTGTRLTGGQRSAPTSPCEGMCAFKCVCVCVSVRWDWMMQEMDQTTDSCCTSPDLSQNLLCVLAIVYLRTGQPKIHFTGWINLSH